jgi:hypothetical protein
MTLSIPESAVREPATAFKEAMKAADLTCRYIPQRYNFGGVVLLGTGGVTILIGRHPQP